MAYPSIGWNQKEGHSPLGAPLVQSTPWFLAGGSALFGKPAPGSTIPLTSELSAGAQAEGYNPQAPSGQGASFLDSLAYGGRMLSDPGKYIDPMAGGAFDDNSPFIAQRFVSEQMRPGGYLSDAYQSRVAALGLRGLLGSGMQSYGRSMNSLGATGLNRRYATGISGGILDRMTMDARQFMTGQVAQQQERQYDATKGVIDLMAESARASKQNYVNYLTAKESAAATKSAGKTSGIGSIIGGVLSAFSDARLKKNVTTVLDGSPRVVSWDWNEEAEALGLYGGGIGYIAQEVEAVWPDRVVEDESGYLRVIY